ncbi:proline utilization trans-activator [Microdochium nivale]|nr:proline utilization trans-activator [Microdochium nivale]
MTLDPSLPPSDALNPRSCVVCRKRKVRCDKHMPCSNCRKANIQCVFPAPGRAPRRPRPKDPNAPPKQASEREVELMKRLRKLEGIVEDLSGQVEFETAKHPSSNDGSPNATTESGLEDRRLHIDPAQRRTPHSDPGDAAKAGHRLSLDSGISSPSIGVRRDFGRLVLNEKGKTKYVSNALWAKVNDEINELRAQTQQLSDHDTDFSDTDETPEAHSYGEHGDHHGFVLGYKSSDVDLSKLHPPQTQIPFIWQVYVDNVDPLIKILHVPTMSKTIRELRTHMEDLSPGMEALLFSIYYAAVTSMEPDEVLSSLGTEKSTLTDQFRFACEQALAKADFLTSTELVVAQAFAIFLVLVRRHDDTRFAWTLTAVLVRMAHTMGLHREGTALTGLKPFEIEMRRRLWWAMCIIDLRGAEDHGTELSIAQRSFDVRLPLNINDADIHPDSSDFPKEREGFTDTTFCLIRFEICSFARKMYMAHSGFDGCQDSLGAVSEREEMVESLYQKIEQKYLGDSVDKNRFPLHWAAVMMHRLIMSKMRLLMYQPVLASPDDREVLSEELQDRVFLAAVDAVEYTRLLNSEPKCRQWRWLFTTYTQFNGVAYVLFEIIRRPWSSSIERGWQALNATLTDPLPTETNLVALRAAVWVPMRKLMIKAKRYREKELARLRADPEAARQLDLLETNRNLPASFRHLSASMRNSQALERWRKLVGREGLDPRTENVPESDKIAPDTSAPSSSLPIPEPTPLQQTFLNQGMSNPQFNQNNPYQAAFVGGIFNTGIYDPSGTGSIPQAIQQTAEPPVQQGSMGFSSNPASTGSMTPADGNALASASNSMMEAQPDQNAVMSDGTPSWLWANQWAGGLPGEGANMDYLDQDINMDEDFSWQNWQDTLRGFDADNTLGIGRPGFTGGI